MKQLSAKRVNKILKSKDLESNSRGRGKVWRRSLTELAGDRQEPWSDSEQVADRLKYARDRQIKTELDRSAKRIGLLFY